MQIDSVAKKKKKKTKKQKTTNQTKTPEINNGTIFRLFTTM